MRQNDLYTEISCPSVSYRLYACMLIISYCVCKQNILFCRHVLFYLHVHVYCHRSQLPIFNCIDHQRIERGWVCWGREGEGSTCVLINILCFDYVYDVNVSMTTADHVTRCMQLSYSVTWSWRRKLKWWSEVYNGKLKQSRSHFL